MTYDEYLKTDHWQQVRAATLSLYGHRCAMCHTNFRLNVHHVRYKRDGKSILFHEQQEDLIVLCKDCHEFWHRAQRMDPTKLERVTDQMLNGNRLSWQPSVDRYRAPVTRKLPPLPSMKGMRFWTDAQHRQYKHIKKLRMEIIREQRGGK